MIGNMPQVEENVKNRGANLASLAVRSTAGEFARDPLAVNSRGTSLVNLPEDPSGGEFSLKDLGTYSQPDGVRQILRRCSSRPILQLLSYRSAIAQLLLSAASRRGPSTACQLLACPYNRLPTDLLLIPN